MQCWSCGAYFEQPSFGKLPFRACCEACDAALHCCRNCAYYKPGLPNDCAVPETDSIPDRTANNLCEEFKLLGKGPTKTANPNDVAKRLFGEEVDKLNQDPKKRFDNLFDK